MITAEPTWTLAQAKAELNQIHDGAIKDYYVLFGRGQWVTAETYRSDLAKSVAYWKRLNYKATAGPFCDIVLARDEANACIASDRRYALEKEKAQQKMLKQWATSRNNVD